MRSLRVPILYLPPLKEAVFIERPNRFLGIVSLDGIGYKEAHIHDPGRLLELLYRKNKILLKRESKLGRKTDWDIISAWCKDHWVFIHSGYHRVISYLLLKGIIDIPYLDISSLKAEKNYKNTRFDFFGKTFYGEDVWIEVKGCTLAKKGVALFPDAPTKRGQKHLKELISLSGKRILLILVFRKDAKIFSPNRETDPKFSELFFKAAESGVEVITAKLLYENGTIYYLGKIPTLIS